MSQRLALADLPLRPELVGQTPYGAPQLDVPVRLNTNENPYAPSSKVRKQMVEAVEQVVKSIDRYPDREAIQLRQALADYLGFSLGPGNIWVANGSNEIMVHLLSAFGGPGRKVLTFEPTYSMYPEYARNTHTEYATVSRRADFGLDSGDVLAAASQNNADILIITTPNNPTGTLTPVAVIDEICAGFDGIVIVDEAYIEFAEYPLDSAIALLPKYPKLVVTRTMSKAFAFAGGRLGYLAASPAIVDACRIVRLPYHLSSISQAIALVALKNSGEMLAKVEQLRVNIRQTQSWLKSKGLTVIPSQANFCLFGRFADRHDVWEKLVAKGVLIREVGPRGYLRVSAGTPEEMTTFREALSDVLSDLELKG